MISVGDIGLDLKLNKKEFTDSMNGITKLAKKAGALLAGAFAVKKLVDFGKSCIDLGSDLSEVQNVVDVTFGSMSQRINDYAKEARSLSGLSETMAKQFTGNYGAMAKAFGFTTDQAYEMSTSLTSLAGDVASFYNLDQKAAYGKLKSVFTGESESLKELGVVMSQTALDTFALTNGFGKTTAQMTEAEKVSLRYKFVQKQLSAASGDFARTSGGWANQMRILNLQFESFKATIGQGLINALTPALRALNALMEVLNKVANAFKDVTEGFFGHSDAGGTAAAANNMALAADATEDMNQSLKKASKYLAGFDEMAKVSDGTAAAAAVPQVASTQEGLSDQITPSETKELGRIGRILNNLKETMENLRPTVEFIWEEVLKPLGEWTAQTLLNTLDSISGDLKWLSEHPKITFALIAAASTFAAVSAVKSINTALAGMSTMGQIGVAVAVSVIGWNLGHSIYENLTGDTSGEYTKGFAETFSEIWDVIVNDGEIAKQAWCDMWNDFSYAIYDLAPDFFDGANEIVYKIQCAFENFPGWIKGVFDSAVDKIHAAFTGIGDFFVGIWNSIKNAFSSVGTWFTNAFNTASNGVKGAFAATGGFFSGVWNSIKNTFSSVGTWFTGKFLGASGGLKIAFSGVKNFFTNIWSSIKGIFNHVPDWFKDTFASAWQKVKNVFSKGGEIFVDIKNGVLDGLKGVINGLIKGINQVITIPFNGLNSALNGIKNVNILGLEPFGFLPTIPVPQIPMLAEGGYVKANTPQLAIIGDNRHQGEIVSPEGKLMSMAVEAANLASGGNASMLSRIITLLELLCELVQDGSDIVLTIDGEEIARSETNGRIRLKRRFTTAEIEYV